MQLIKIAQERNIELPPDRNINSDVVYISSNRLTKIIPRENVNKEYLVRIYRYDDDMYSVIGWNGRRGGTLRPQPKYFGDSRRSALNIAQQIIDDKIRSGYSEDRTPITDDITREYMGRPELIADQPANRPTAPNRSHDRDTINGTPSIRLPPEYIPNTDSRYIAVRKMVQGNREFLIVLYIYPGSWYSVIEWYSPNGTEYRIHPKLLTQSIADATRMVTRLVEQKLDDGWGQERDTNAINVSLERLNRGIYATLEAPTSATSGSSEMDRFISEMTNNRESTIAGYWYNITINHQREIVTEHLAEDHLHTIRSNIFITFDEAVRQAVLWGRERERSPRTPRQTTSPSQPITPVPQAKETPPKDRSQYYSLLLDENEEDLYLKDLISNANIRIQKTSSNNWYIKTSKSIGDELRGYFKFITKTNDSAIPYNIWWEGLGDYAHITKHDLPEEIYERYRDVIEKAIKENSLKTYNGIVNQLI